MQFRILGSVELWAEGRTHTLVGSAQTRMVCASLAYEAGRPVHADRLIERLWEDNPPRNARQNLRPHISRLRSAIIDLAGPDGPEVEQRDGTYTLRADPQLVDAHLHAALATRARSPLDRGEEEEALRLVEEAERLWRGEPLAGLTGLWAEQTREILAHQRLRIALVRADVLLRRGHFDDVVTLLSPLVAQHPTDEALSQRLMLGLYGRGLPREALDTYHDTAERLRDGGAEPGPRLRRIRAGVMRNAPIESLLPGPQRQRPQRHVNPPVPNALPRHAPLVGRQVELRTILSALSRAPASPGSAHGSGAVVTIHGMAGVGKSTLALCAGKALCEEFPDGQLYVEFHTHTGEQEPPSPTATLHHLLRQLGVHAQEIPPTFDEAASLWRSHLARRRVLVVLDDVADAAQITPLIPGSDSPSAVITTSRQHLAGLPGQCVVPLDELPDDDAIAVFRQLLGEDRAATRAELIELVRLCDHLPLAMELLANRLISHRSWGVTDLLHQLRTAEDPLSEFRHGEKSLGRVFGFSYQRLSMAQRLVFRRLGLHIGTDFAPRSAAAATGLDQDETEAALETLLDYHFLQEPVPHRYRAHDLWRAYARHLATTEESEQERVLIVERQLDYFLTAADAADRLLYSHRPRIQVDLSSAAVVDAGFSNAQSAHQWFSQELDTLIVAAERSWDAGSPHRAALYAHVLGGFIEAERRGSMVASLHQRAVAHWRSTGNKPAEARALLDLSLMQARVDDFRGAIWAARRSVSLSRELCDTETLAEALHRLAVPFGRLGQYETSLSLQREALEIRMRSNDRYQQARTQNNLAITFSQLGNHAAARDMFLAARDGFCERGDKRTLALINNNLGDLCRETDEHEQALIYYEEALEIAMDHGSILDRITVQMNLAEACRDRGELSSALTLYEEALPLSMQAHSKLNEAIAHNGIGSTLHLLGNHDGALIHLERSLEISREIGAAPEEFQAHVHLALTKNQLTQPTTAIIHAEQALEIAERLQISRKISIARCILAKIADDGDYSIAAEQ